jgi:hypothetical protein
MATPEPLEPSRRLQSAAAAERARLGRELGRLDERVDRLGHELEEIEAHRDAIRRRLTLLARLAHFGAEPDEPAPPVARLHRSWPETPEVLTGARIREAAARIAATEGAAARPLHYQEWLELLELNGVAIAGKDPAATLLTQLARSPVIRRAGARGCYALDRDAPARLRARVRDLRVELARPEAADGTLGELAEERDRRIQLSRELARAERELEEALRVLEAEQ